MITRSIIIACIAGALALPVRAADTPKPSPCTPMPLCQLDNLGIKPGAPGPGLVTRDSGIRPQGLQPADRSTYRLPSAPAKE